MVLRADLVLVAILVKDDPARNFERPPSHPVLFENVYSGCWVRLEALQFSSSKQKIFHLGGRAGVTA